jgi:hypothetical protein
MRTSSMVGIGVCILVIFAGLMVLKMDDHPAKQHGTTAAVIGSTPPTGPADRPIMRWTKQDPEWQQAVATVENYGRSRFEHMARREKSHSESSGFVEFPRRHTAQEQLDAVLRSCAEDQHACLDDRPIAIAPEGCGKVGAIESPVPDCDTFDEVPQLGDKHYQWWLETRAKIVHPYRLMLLHGISDFVPAPDHP